MTVAEVIEFIVTEFIVTEAGLPRRTADGTLLRYHLVSEEGAGPFPVTSTLGELGIGARAAPPTW